MLTLVSLEQRHGRAFPLKIDHYHINIAVNNQLTTTKIKQVFANPNDYEVDGIYIFPVPDDAALSNFALSIDEEPVTGQLLSHEESLRTYMLSVRQGRNTAIIEHIGTRAFVADVPRIPANGERHIEFEYSQIIQIDDDQVKYTHPLSLAKSAYGPIKDIAINMEIESEHEIRTINSAAHELNIDRKNDHHVHISYEGRDIEPDDDFQCYYSISDDDFGITLLTHRADESEEGYFMLLVSPKYEVKKTDIIEKDFIFVLDHSGSMARRKIEQAKEALRYCVQNLNDGDRFNLILFNTGITSLSDRLNRREESFGDERSPHFAALPHKLIDVEDGREEALQFIEGIEARGGTNINDALLTALVERPDPNRPRIMVFLTDGCPTVGLRNVTQILENVTQTNANRSRIFVFGVGYDVNARLLDKMAADNGGTRNYVKPHEDIEVAVSSLFRKMNEPVLVDVTLDFGQVIVKELVPINLPDMFRGEQLTLLGRYESPGDTALKLQGNIGNEPQEFSKNVHFAEIEKDNDFLPTLWAQRRIAELVDHAAMNGLSEELHKEIERISIEYDVITPYTFFKYADDGSRKFVIDIDKVYRNSSKDKIIIGREKIEEDKTRRHMRQYADTKYIGRKTFHHHGGIWVDTKYDRQSERKIIEYGSDEYFELVNHSNELEKCAKIGLPMIFCYNGENYEIRLPRPE